MACGCSFLTGIIKWLYCCSDSGLRRGRAKALPFYFETGRIDQMTEALQKMPLNKIKAAKETFFKRKPDAKGVFVINHYNAAEKEYSCSNWETGAEIFLKAKTPVFVGFTY